MTRQELEKMERWQLVCWLECERSISCYGEEPTEELREVAIDDFDRCSTDESDNCYTENGW